MMSYYIYGDVSMEYFADLGAAKKAAKDRSRGRNVDGEWVHRTVHVCHSGSGRRLCTYTGGFIRYTV